MHPIDVGKNSIPQNNECTGKVGDAVAIIPLHPIMT